MLLRNMHSSQVIYRLLFRWRYTVPSNSNMPWLMYTLLIPRWWDYKWGVWRSASEKQSRGSRFRYLTPSITSQKQNPLEGNYSADNPNARLNTSLPKETGHLKENTLQCPHPPTQKKNQIQKTIRRDAPNHQKSKRSVLSPISASTHHQPTSTRSPIHSPNSSITSILFPNEDLKNSWNPPRMNCVNIIQSI